MVSVLVSLMSFMLIAAADSKVAAPKLISKKPTQALPKNISTLRSFVQLKNDLSKNDVEGSKSKTSEVSAPNSLIYKPASNTEHWKRMEQDRPGELPQELRDPVTNRLRVSP